MNQSVSALQAIGGVLALVGSVAFAFAVFQISHLATTKRSTYRDFISEVERLRIFVAAEGINTPLGKAAEAFAWELGNVGTNDFPLLDWDERIRPLAPFLDPDQAEPANGDSFERDLLDHLARVETIVNEFSILGIRQVGVEIASGFVRKAFLVLSALIVATVVMIMGDHDALQTALAGLPVFFGAMAVLLLMEAAWFVWRESNNLADQFWRAERTSSEV